MTTDLKKSKKNNMERVIKLVLYHFQLCMTAYLWNVCTFYL